ncbi:MAG TPA: hypothetical protein VNO34_05865 [Actinomycetota bacterium]|nr:hypothetical protein [Actinomycetota bacterium]
MAELDVRLVDEDERAFRLDVSVREEGSETRHRVTVRREDFRELGERFGSPEAFVRRCFEFLLEREPKEAILRAFDVREIARYFPEFPQVIGAP